MVRLARDELGLPVGVVVNRDGIGDSGGDQYCSRERIPILMRIPLNRRIAGSLSEGHALIDALPELWFPNPPSGGYGRTPGLDPCCTPACPQARRTRGS